MDHFENIVRLLLEREGYWVRSSFKVNLTKEEKRYTGKHSIPRPEIDLVAFHPKQKKLLAIEVKSFFDSTGVNPAELEKVHEVAEGTYKMFTSERLRGVVLRRLSQDLFEAGLITELMSIQLGLVAGNVKNGCEDQLARLAKEKGWFYWSPRDVKERVISFSKESYENEAAVITAKILLRE